MNNIDELGYGNCSVCGKFELIVIKTREKLVCWYCAQRPAGFVIEKLELKR